MKRYFCETESFAQGVKCRIPVISFKSDKPGPKVVVMAGQHGREVNGIAAIARIIEQLGKIPETLLCGEIIFLPVVNPIGLRSRRQDFPIDYLTRNAEDSRENLNRHWGLEPDGTLPAMIAETVFKKILKDADAVLDLHCWELASMAMGYKEDVELIKAVGFRNYMVYLHPQPVGILYEMMRANKIPSVLYEFYKHDYALPTSVSEAICGITNFLKYFNILPGNFESASDKRQLADKDKWIRTKAEGVVNSMLNVGDRLKKGEEIYTVYSPDTFEVIEREFAPYDGILHLGAFTLRREIEAAHLSAMVYPGDLVAVIKPFAEQE